MSSTNAHASRGCNGETDAPLLLEEAVSSFDKCCTLTMDKSTEMVACATGRDELDKGGCSSTGTGANASLTADEDGQAATCSSETQEPATCSTTTATGTDDSEEDSITVLRYKDESQIDDIMCLMTKDLSEPYSIYTYRYFIHRWPELCFLAFDTATGRNVGAIVCKLDAHYRNSKRRGYIAMLAVDERYRRRKIGSRLVSRAIDAMRDIGCDEVVLEAEVSNTTAMRLYGNLGFIREKRLFRYYLNGADAFRLKLYLSLPQSLLIT